MPAVMRSFRLSPLLLLIGLLAGCNSVTYQLPGHQAAAHTAPVTLRAGESRLALSTSPRLPVPGGFELSLASENPAVVSVQREAGAGGSARVRLVARAAGTAVVHYVNRYAAPPDATDAETVALLRAGSLGAFTVTVTP